MKSCSVSKNCLEKVEDNLRQLDYFLVEIIAPYSLKMNYYGGLADLDENERKRMEVGFQDFQKSYDKLFKHCKCIVSKLKEPIPHLYLLSSRKLGIRVPGTTKICKDFLKGSESIPENDLKEIKKYIFAYTLCVRNLRSKLVEIPNITDPVDYPKVEVQCIVEEYKSIFDEDISLEDFVQKYDTFEKLTKALEQK